MKAALTLASKLTVGALFGIGCTICAPRSLRADPLRLRADAIGSTTSPVGLLVLRGEDKFKPWLDAEAVAWVGATSTPDVTGDALVLTVRARDLQGRGEVRVGRFVHVSGAVRPLHIDGLRATGRILASGTSVEVFTGAPVVMRFGTRPYDVAWGGRISQIAFGTLSFGVSYLQRHVGASVLDREVGPDLTFAPTEWFDFAGRAAYDLVSSRPTDALASLALKTGPLRTEAFVTHRSAGRLLPATSLFSVLGDIPSTTSGLSLRLHAAPRLDLWATGAALVQGDELGGYATGRASLALDDAHDGSVGFEVRRQYFGTARWSGGRVFTRVPVSRTFAATAEFELVVPDKPVGTSKVWPWGLLAIAYRISPNWDVAGAVEAMRTRDDRNEVHGLVRATWSLEKL
ncbi:MAG: hypothetical protein IPJ34_29895 [Myxococcales bacterium]|nr:hypothetical protein [Myxococcales bacterium]